MRDLFAEGLFEAGAVFLGDVGGDLAPLAHPRHHVALLKLRHLTTH